MRLTDTEEVESVLQTICQQMNAGPFSCSQLMSVAMRFVDPRLSEASVLTMRLPRRQLNMQQYQCGLLLIYDGITAVDVSRLNARTVDEHEVWLENCCVYIAHRAHDPRVLSKTLRMPFPVTKQVLAQKDVDELIRLASDVRLEVVVLTPYSVRWHEAQNISDQITGQEEMASPKHVDNDGLVAAHDDGEPEQCSHALECIAEPPPNLQPRQRPRRKAKQFCEIQNQCQCDEEHCGKPTESLGNDAKQHKEVK